MGEVCAVRAAWQAGHWLEATCATPTTIKTPVYQEIFQKFQISKSCSRNKMPRTKNKPPHIVMHFLHIHISPIAILF